MNSGQGMDSFCMQNQIDGRTMTNAMLLKKLLGRRLKDMNLIGSSRPDKPANNVNSNNKQFIRGVLAFGLYPNLSLKKPRSWGRTYDIFTSVGVHDVDKDQFLSRRSVNHGLLQYRHGEYVVYFSADANKKGNHQIKDCSFVNAGIVKMFTPLGKNPQYYSLLKKLEDKFKGEKLDVTKLAQDLESQLCI